MFIANIHADDVECSILQVREHIYTSQDKLVSLYHGSSIIIIGKFSLDLILVISAVLRFLG